MLWGAGLLLLLAMLVALLVFFPWDVLRGPVNRYVSDQLGRRFEITQRLSVALGRTATVRLDGLEFANPAWAAEPYLIKAKAVEFDIKLWPLLHGRLELPRVALFEPQVNLQLQPDGRRSWALARDTSDSQATPAIGTLTVDRGTLKYRAAHQGADITAQISMVAPGTTSPGTTSSGTTNSSATNSSAADVSAGSDPTRKPKPQPTALPLRYQASGKWRNEPFTANGRAGGVLALGRDVNATFPLEVNAQSGKTTLSAKGTVDNLQTFAGLTAGFDLQGRNLADLYKLAGVVLPSTPPYKLRGQLGKQGPVWSTRQMVGVLGQSDLSGDLQFDTAAAVPLLTGKVQSKVLDFNDLLPVIGLPSLPAAPQGLQPQGNKTTATAQAPAKKVLPTATLDLVRLQAMQADVVYSALAIRHAAQLPLDKGSVRVKLNNGVMQLEPLVLGVAGGSLAGRVLVDTNVSPAAFDTRFDLRGVALNRLFPTIESTKTSLGNISGQVNLTGRGNSMAQMLGNASGDVAVLMGQGEISNILLEFLGLDGGEILKFLIRGDRNVSLRCAAVAFDVKQGLMDSKVIVLDTSDTVINGAGQISLASETLDVLLKPQPKDKSILSLRSPLKIGGTFAAPTAGPDKAALAARAGLAVALGAVNPFLALLATIETGPGQDADCTGALAKASSVASNKSSKAKPSEPVASANKANNANSVNSANSANTAKPASNPSQKAAPDPSVNTKGQ